MTRSPAISGGLFATICIHIILACPPALILTAIFAAPASAGRGGLCHNYFPPRIWQFFRVRVLPVTRLQLPVTRLLLRVWTMIEGSLLVA
jgi:hypothetical protein